MKVELTTKELDIIITALRIDTISDETPEAAKVALLDKLNNLIQKYN